MTPRQRLLEVLAGRTPDAVPWFGDLSHWYSVESGRGFVPTNTVGDVDSEMVRAHRELGVGIYLNMGTLYDVAHDGGVSEEVSTGPEQFIWRIETPLGTIQEERRYSDVSLSWNIEKRMVRDLDDLAILKYAIERQRFVPKYERYTEWMRGVGEMGVPFASAQYSGLGLLISRFMGIEATIFAIHDQPDVISDFVETVNASNLKLIDLLAASPAPAVLHSDNFSSDVQSPELFRRFTARYTRRMADRLHESGKILSVHIDGRLKGLLGEFAACGVDCADAVTPTPMGDLTPQECREEGGSHMILWGGIPPSTWLPSTPDSEFVSCVRAWLDLKKHGSRLVLAPGDQVPPGTPAWRIKMVADLVEKYGSYGRTAGPF